MRLYKFYPENWGKDALTKKRLKITTGADINDPFELAACRADKKCDRQPLRLWKRFMFSKVGMISFCSSWSNPVIWSHYAESHRGLCLGFEVKDELVVSVDYVEERIEVPQSRIASTVDLDDGGLGFRLFKTKFHHWAYESEKRISFDLLDPSLEREGDLRFASFSPEMQLKEVVMGVDYVKNSAPELSASLRSDGVKITTARAAFKTFEIIDQKLARLKKSL